MAPTSLICRGFASSCPSNTVASSLADTTPLSVVEWSPAWAKLCVPALVRMGVGSAEVRSVPLQAGAIDSSPECHAVVERIPSDAALRPMSLSISAPLAWRLRAQGDGVKDRRRHEHRRHTRPYRPYRLTVPSRKSSPHRAKRWNAFGFAPSYGRASHHG